MADQENSIEQESHYDVFISYAHLDNQVSEGKGWVTMLHEALKIRLDQLRGEESRIWRDDTLQGNEIFGDEIVNVLDNADIFVSILTPRYTKSSWCSHELETFLNKHSKRKNSLKATNKTTIFKVIKTPVEPDDEPPYFRHLIGFPFVREDSDPPLELYPAWGKTADHEVTAKINDLAQSIKKMLRVLKDGDQENEQASKGNVYLADTASDLNETRNKIVRELEEQGYTVLPDTVLSRTASGVKAQVEKDLQNSLCSVHLIGDRHGFLPENDLGSGKEERDLSAVEMQVDIAAAHSRRNSDFFQLIWLHGEGNCKESQKVFREKIINLELQHSDDVLEVSYQDLKNEILDKLSALQRDQGQETEMRRLSNPVIYLLYTKDDRPEVKDLRHYLKENKYEVLKPIFSGDKKEIAARHVERLNLADAILLFWGKGDEAWFEGQCDAVRNVLSSGTVDKSKSIGIVFSDPRNEEKEEFLEDNQKSCVAQLIECFGDLPHASLEGFLASLEDREKGEVQ